MFLTNIHKNRVLVINTMEKYQQSNQPSRRDFILKAFRIAGAASIGGVAVTYGYPKLIENRNNTDVREKPEFKNPYEQMATLDSLLDREITGISYDVPVLIDFTALWCGYCPPIDEAVEDAAENHYSNNQLFVVRCDVSKNPEVGNKYVGNVTPELIIKKEGKNIRIDPEVLHNRVAIAPKDKRTQNLISLVDETIAQFK